MARTAKPGVDIYDEGVLLGNASSIDFAGAGISGSYNPTTGRATETVTGGGGGSGTPVVGEIVPGSGTTYTLAHTPLAGTLAVYINELRKPSTPGVDYTLSGAVITTVQSWGTGDVIADYSY